MSTELLKRADFLPRHAEARRLRPGILTDQPTEEYVVTTRTRGEAPLRAKSYRSCLARGL